MIRDIRKSRSAHLIQVKLWITCLFSLGVDNFTPRSVNACIPAAK